MAKLNPRKWAKTTLTGSLWLIVLVPLLAISGYSLYFVATALGVPKLFAIPMSAGFDGTTLLAAEYSLRYAQAGLSGSGPRTVVRLGALLAAFIQTLHARLGHEPAGSWALWAALPILAVVVYDIHIRWERRRALAAAGVAYPAPLPAFGSVTWIMFPMSTWSSMRGIVEARRGAVVEAANKRHTTLDGRDYHVIAQEPAPAITATEEPAAAVARPAPVRNVTSIRRVPAQRPDGGRISPHSPTKHIRQWAQAQPERFGVLGDRGKIPADIIAAYNDEHAVPGAGNE
jgi:hypothetical protein